MIGVTACPEHGALYYQLDVEPGGTTIEAVKQRPLGSDLPQPVSGTPMICPKCSRGLERYLVPDGTFPATEGDPNGTIQA